MCINNVYIYQQGSPLPTQPNGSLPPPGGGGVPNNNSPTWAEIISVCVCVRVRAAGSVCASLSG